MPRYKSSKRQSGGGDKHGSRRARIKQEQEAHAVTFMMEEKAATVRLEESIFSLFGIPGIGKSKFAEELGHALKAKHGLSHSGAYFLQCERINHPWKIRYSITDTWPTFRKFIDDAEKDPGFVKTVKLWVIDTLDSLVPKGISTVCADLGIVDLKEATKPIGDDMWMAEGWQELKYELRYQILRLAYLGPGVLILSHERTRTEQEGRLKHEKASMDVSNSIYNTVGNDCSMILRMKTVEGVKRAKRQKPARCLSFLSSADELAKDNLGYLTKEYPGGTMPFTDERDAVGKILSCFGSGAVKRVKKKKKKKKARRK